MANHGKARIKPTALKKLHGTLNVTRERRRGGVEPVPEGDLIEPPAGLTRAQREIWRYAIRHAPKGVLMLCDVEMMKSWVLAVDRRNELQRILEGRKGEPGWEVSPVHRNLDRITMMLTRMAGEIGFSPASRPRIRVEAPRETDPNSPWEILKLTAAGAFNGSGKTSSSAH
jgi:phage terminase small subunit